LSLKLLLLSLGPLLLLSLKPEQKLQRRLPKFLQLLSKGKLLLLLSL
jgi:hypothetical protein